MTSRPQIQEGESQVRHVCGGSDTCMCVYDPALNPGLKTTRYVPTDEAAVERAARALCKKWWPRTTWGDWPAKSQEKFREHARAAFDAAAEAEEA